MEVNLPTELEQLVYKSASEAQISADEFIADAIRRSEAARFSRLQRIESTPSNGMNIAEKLRQFAAKQTVRDIRFDDSRAGIYAGR